MPGCLGAAACQKALRGLVSAPWTVAVSPWGTLLARQTSHSCGLVMHLQSTLSQHEGGSFLCWTCSAFLPVVLLSCAGPAGLCVPVANHCLYSRQQGSLRWSLLDPGLSVARHQWPVCRVGDGDCGTTLRKGAEVIRSDLTSRLGCQCMAMLKLRLCTVGWGVLLSPQSLLFVRQTTVTGSPDSCKLPGQPSRLTSF